LVKRSGAVATANYIPKWTRSLEWNDIGVGEQVKVVNEAHVQDGAVIAVGVYGGTSGNETVRFFRPERVTKFPKKRTRKTALTDSEE
jgi:hypothetical protein